MGLKRWIKVNSFCPTGEGGGVKPDCSPSQIKDMTDGKLMKAYQTADQKFTKEADKAWKKTGLSVGLGDLVKLAGENSALGKAAKKRGDLLYEIKRRNIG